MIYTIGRTSTYTQYFFEQGTPKKAIGGSVWKTYDEAYFHTLCEDNYTVYGVVADWDKDTVPNINPNADWHDLLIDAELVQLGESE